MANDNTTLPEPITREEIYLNAIAQNSGGGGGAGLPAVTNDDNGDVLTVVDGVWDKAAPSGGLVVGCVVDDNNLWTMDKTWGEIASAFRSGQAVYVNTVFTGQADGDITFMAVVGLSHEESGAYFLETAGGVGRIVFIAASENDYPVFDEN